MPSACTGSRATLQQVFIWASGRCETRVPATGRLLARRPLRPLFACKHPVTDRRASRCGLGACITVRPMSRERSDAQPGGQAAPQRAQARLRVAVIDRDPGFMQVLANRLDALGCEHRAAVSTPATVETLVAMRLNALVLDLDGARPRELGLPRARAARAFPGLAVIVCTGPSSVAQRVRGLRLGADAWMTKPCHRRGADLRDRGGGPPSPAPRDAASSTSRRTVGEITIRPDLYQAYVGRRQSLELTAREFEILQLLAQSDRVLRREEIYERVWGYAMAHGDRSVDVFVRKLRQKLRAASPHWSYIHTHFGVGYRFAPESEADGSKRTAGCRRRASSELLASRRRHRARPGAERVAPAPRAPAARRHERPRSQVVHICRHDSITRSAARARAASRRMSATRRVTPRGARGGAARDPARGASRAGGRAGADAVDPGAAPADRARPPRRPDHVARGAVSCSSGGARCGRATGRSTSTCASSA